VKIYQVKGGALVPSGDWFQGFPELLQKTLDEEVKKG
jgi:hypothetical protein